MLRNRNKLVGLMFVLPWIIGFLVFTAYPLYRTLQFSFSRVRFLLNGTSLENIGFENYAKVLFEDPDFKLAMPSYFIQLITFVPMILIFSMLLALLLNSRLRMRKVFRAIFFLPVIIMSGPLVGNLRMMGATTLKGLTSFPIYKFIAHSFPGFISAPILYIFENAILILWFSGVQILIFLSVLQKIDRNIYEASMIDGASGWQQFWKITIPTLKPFFLLNAIYTIVDVSMFSINPIIAIIKQGLFQINRGFGFSAAASWIYFIIILIAVVIAFIIFGRDKYAMPEVKPMRRQKAVSIKKRG